MRQVAVVVGRDEQQERMSDDSERRESGQETGPESSSISDSDESGNDNITCVPRPSLFPQTLVVENKGNVARDHLSAERTFLAYVRTSLICVAAGVGAIYFALFSRLSHLNFSLMQASYNFLLSRHRIYHCAWIGLERLLVQSQRSSG